LIYKKDCVRAFFAMSKSKKPSARGKSPCRGKATGPACATSSDAAPDEHPTSPDLWLACCGYCALETAAMCMIKGARSDVLCEQALFFCILWRVSYWDFIGNGLAMHVLLRVSLLWLASCFWKTEAVDPVFDWLPTGLATHLTGHCAEDAGSIALFNVCETDAKSEFLWLSGSLAAALSVPALVLCAFKGST
jgi:hypothetical protein